MVPPSGLVASFSVSCSQLTCDFDASSSTGSITSYDWAFGDGATAPNGGVTLSHTYVGPGGYAVMLTVHDATGSASTTQTVTCTQRGPNVRCK